MKKAKKILGSYSGELTVKQRLVRLETIMIHIVDNELSHIWSAIKVIVGLLSGIFMALLYEFFVK